MKKHIFFIAITTAVLVGLVQFFIKPTDYFRYKRLLKDSQELSRVLRGYNIDAVSARSYCSRYAVKFGSFKSCTNKVTAKTVASQSSYEVIASDYLGFLEKKYSVDAKSSDVGRGSGGVVGEHLTLRNKTSTSGQCDAEYSYNKSSREVNLYYACDDTSAFTRWLDSMGWYKKEG
jgi:hypothetical protein